MLFFLVRNYSATIVTRTSAATSEAPNKRPGSSAVSLAGPHTKIKEQIKEMMAIQDELNCQLNPDWKKQGWNFKLAANVEMVEALDHYGWKWWKHQAPDIDQVKMEMADILHFLLSELSIEGFEDNAFNEILDSENGIESFNFLRDAKLFMHLVTAKYSLLYLLKCCSSIGMSIEELRHLYLGKAILN